MAGRGRGATIPAWMSQQMKEEQNKDSTNGIQHVPTVNGQFDPPEEGSTRRKRSRSHSRPRHRRRYSRSRSRHRENRRRHHGRDRYRERREEPVKTDRIPRRQRKPSNFDVYPPGVDDTNAAEFAAQAILQHNMAALQGAVGPAAFGGAPPITPGAPVDVNTTAAHTRHARRIYVGGIEQNVKETDIMKFFDGVIAKALNTKVKDPVLSVYINRERHFAFVELRSIELATACMSLDGIQFQGNPVKIRRPNDYNPALIPSNVEPTPEFDLSALGIVGTNVTDGPGKIFVGNLPLHLNEEQIKELLQAFGALRAFHLVRDTQTNISKGYAFCEYADHSITAKAVEGLNELQLGDKQLSVRQAGSTEIKPMSVGETVQAMGEDPQQAAMQAMALAGVSIPMTTTTPTRILVLKNMVTEEDLENDEEYEDIVDDIKSECEKYGNVLSITVPRAGQGNDRAIGQVFVEFESVECSKKAAEELHGRGFASRIVEADYLDEEKYATQELA